MVSPTNTVERRYSCGPSTHSISQPFLSIVCLSHQVVSPTNTVERRYSVWIGGSILASLGTFQQASGGALIACLLAVCLLIY